MGATGSSRRLAVLFLLAPLASGCGTTTPPEGAPDACARECTARTCGDDGCGGSCGACVDGKRCSAAGQCETPPTTVVGEVELLHQVALSDPTSVLAQVGKAEARFFDDEPLPVDHRSEYLTPEGERCTVEVNSVYPSYYDELSWPTGPGRSAGKVTFAVAGAPGPVELDPLSLDTPPEETYGYGYIHKDVPPPLKDGAVTFGDFFPVAYVPFGAAFSVTTLGGPHVAAQTFSGGHLPEAFTITEPQAEATPAASSLVAPLPVAWAPAQPGATMEIFLTAGDSSSFALISCTVTDDGSTTVPAAALQNFGGVLEFGIQLRRSVVSRVDATTVQGGPLKLSLIGRHARIGKSIPVE